MIRSMTGYGAAEVELADGRILRAEIRTGNQRHLSVSASLPRGWESVRPQVLERVREGLARGGVSVAVTCEDNSEEDAAMPGLDMDRARRYVDLLTSAGEVLEVGGSLDINTLAGLPGVLRSRGIPAEDAGPDEMGLGECIAEALAGVVAMRESEGRRLEEGLRSSVASIVEEVDAVEIRAPRRLLRERDRLRERVAVLTEAVEVDEDRLAREIAYLAEKWDIAEEVARLRSHVTLFLESLDEGGKHGKRKAGKRLGFVVQEMHREANTLGAKANDPAISASAVAIKEELERLREQLENVE